MVDISASKIDLLELCNCEVSISLCMLDNISCYCCYLLLKTIQFHGAELVFWLTIQIECHLKFD